MTGSELLAPYVPRLVVDWLRDDPNIRHRAVAGSLVFADISGFTDLTERLARRGKVGAEEMSDLLNLTFEQVLTAAYDYGAGLVKWGGDAVLLLFDHTRHADMACRAALEMQRTMRKVGRLRTSSGPVTLRMSIGVHSGAFEFLLVGHRHRELVVAGPDVTTVALMEKTADATEVVVSAATAAVLAQAGARLPAIQKGTGLLLTEPPDVSPTPNRYAKSLADIDLGVALAPPLREHLLAGPVDSEHRQIAVGFVEFSGTDELLRREGTGALTEAIEHVVDAAEEAAVVNDITLLDIDAGSDGGKILLVSGAPRTVGDDEARLLNAVRSVVSAGGPLSLRAGVSGGRVFAGDFGPFYRRTYSVAGDCVNLAARLMATAAPGEVIASTAVLERSRTAFEVTPLPPFHVKGKQDPVDAARVGELLRSRPTVETSTLPLVGRSEELSRLLDAYGAAREHHGQVVELVGEPGMGKSRLVQEVQSRVDAAVLWAHGDLYATSTPYEPLRRLLRDQLSAGEDAGDAVVAKALVRSVTALAPDMLPWLPLVGIVAGVVVASTPEVDALGEEFRKERLVMATSEVLGAVLSTPTVFVFDDVHLMDEATVDLLRRLALDVTDRPWLLIVTRRRATTSPLSDLEAVRRIELAPLGADEANRLLATLTDDHPLALHRQTTLAARAGGNPLFLRELAAGVHEMDDRDLDALPDSVEGVIGARIDALRPADRRLLRCAAVLGMTVDEHLFQAMIGPQTDHRLDADWERLAEFVGRDHAGRLAFTHHLVRQVAYEGLPYRRRIVLHGRAGDAIESLTGAAHDDHAEVLSLHFLAAECFDKAWRYSRIAADRARTSYANADAAEFYERALRAAAHLTGLHPEELAAVHESLGEARYVLGEFSRAERALARARRSVHDDPVRLAMLRLKGARICEWRGEYPRALRWVTLARRGLADLKSAASTQLAAQLTARRARIRHLQGRTAEATRLATTACAEAERSDDRSTLAQALEILGWADATMGRPDGDESTRRALEIYVELGDLIGQGRAHNVLGIHAFYLGRWDEAIECYERARYAWERGGDRLNAAIASMNVAEVLSDQGHLDAAADMLQAGFRVFRPAKSVHEMCASAYLLGRIAARSGREGEALSYFGEARRLAVDSGERQEVVLIDALAAECHVMARRAEEALALADATLVAAGELDGAPPMVPLLNRVRGEALAQLGRFEEARDALCRSHDSARARRARQEVALTLDAMLGAGVTPPGSSRSEMVAERAALFTQLGMVSRPPADSARRAATA